MQPRQFFISNHPPSLRVWPGCRSAGRLLGFTGLPDERLIPVTWWSGESNTFTASSKAKVPRSKNSSRKRSSISERMIVFITQNLVHDGRHPSPQQCDEPCPGFFAQAINTGEGHIQHREFLVELPPGLDLVTLGAWRVC